MTANCYFLIALEPEMVHLVGPGRQIEAIYESSWLVALMSLTSVASPLVCPIVDRIGSHHTITGGSALLGAGVAMHGPGAPAAPPSGRAGDDFVGLAASEGHTFRHISAECGDALKILEAQEEQGGGASHEEGHNRTCTDGQMTVLLSREVDGTLHELSKCFPEKECKCKNIKKELKANAKAHDKDATVEVSCGKTEEAEEET